MASAKRSVPHSEDLSVPEPPQTSDLCLTPEVEKETLVLTFKAYFLPTNQANDKR